MKKLIFQLFTLIVFVSNSIAQSGVTSYTAPTDPITYDLKIDASGNKWVGFRKLGAGKFNGASWTTYDTLTSGIASNQVNSIAFDPTGNVWLGTIKGVSKFDGTTWTTFNVINSGLPHDSVTSIYIDNTDIWIGTANGLAKFNGSSWTTYNTTSGLTSNLIQCISVETSGDVWVGTRAGLCKKLGSTWSNFNTTNPYIVNTFNIIAIYIDAANDKWISSKGNLGNGVYKLVGSTLKPLNTLYPVLSASVSAPYSISKGPMGGVSFFGSGLTEIVGSQVYRYTYAGSDYNAVD
nr:hypothetical protein [Bacteroidota bacterium]